MANKYKSEFVEEHGQDQWDLVMGYVNKGNRSLEARNACKLYQRYQKGLNKSLWTIYSILEGNDVVYVGRTGKTLEARWSHHKTAVRTAADTQPLHKAMFNTKDLDTFPEWTIKALTTTNDLSKAIDLEKDKIVEHDTVTCGYNVRVGSGNSNKQHLKAIP